MNQYMYMNKKKFAAPIFPRSFKYELDCLELFRLKKLQQKVQKDEEEDKKRQEAQLKHVKPVNETEENSPKPVEPTHTSFYPRWQQQPHLFAPSETDPCIRKADFSL